MTSEKVFCQSCGSNINKDAVFCKTCGKTVGGSEKNLIQRMNDKINILSIYIGLFVSIIFLFIGSIIYGALVAGGYIDLITYFGLVSITMVFFGGLVIGIIGCDYSDEAKINGGFFVLLILSTLGLVGGAAWSFTVGMSSVISSIFQSSTSSSSLLSSDYSTSSLATQTSVPTDYSFIFEGIVFLLLFIISGMAGCYLGYLIKKAIK
jgi:hypothetical protein